MAADLRVVGEYRGPGEKLTAETLAQQLPDDWVLIANRKLPTQEHDDLDLIAVGRNLIFVIEDKYWGPNLKVTAGAWSVNGKSRQNPSYRVSFLARKLAGLLRNQVKNYPPRGHLVRHYLVLSQPSVTVDWSEAGPESDMVVLLSEAAQALKDDDAATTTQLRPARQATITYLDGWKERSAVPDTLGSYRVIQEETPLGRARIFTAQDDVGNEVILRCYPKHGWGPGADAENLIRRERTAIERLARSGRTLGSQPVFEDDLRQWIIVPVLWQPLKNLPQLMSMTNSPVSPADGDSATVIKFIIDAFNGLKEIHSEGVVHRGIAPARIGLDAEGRVRFTDFYLAQVAGQASVAASLNELADLGAPYRAPECAMQVGSATVASDVYSLALSLLWWLHADPKSEPDPQARPANRDLNDVADTLRLCVCPSFSERPSIDDVVERLEKLIPNPSGSVFAPGEVVKGYRIERRLGEGGFARSWLATELESGSQRVLKEYSDAVPADAARKEFVAAEQIRHDRCARVWGISENPRFLAVDYVKGETLQNACKLPKDAEEYRREALDILKALDYMHTSRNFLHNDVTPGNIIIEPDGSARLIDFGLSRLREHESQPAGTRMYVAPEVMAGGPRSPASDLYGLGVTFLRCMLGRFPFQDVNGEYDPFKLRTPSDEEKLALGPLGVAVVEQFFRLVEPEPSARPRSAAEFAEDLRLAVPLKIQGGGANINPTVDLLRQLYRGSRLGNSGNRGLDSDFAEQTYVDTDLDTKLTPLIVNGDLDLVVLTGNPGDGKTSYLKKLRTYLDDGGATLINEGPGGWLFRTATRTFAALYDASEARNAMTSDELIRAALTPVDPLTPHTALLAINDGRLLQFFVFDHSDEFPAYSKAVRRGLDGKDPDPSSRVAYVDLKRRSLAPTATDPDGIAGRTLDTFTADSRWSTCNTCTARGVCPIFRNRSQLKDAGRNRLLELVTVSHLRRQRRATFRDFRSAAGWLITGDRGCADVHMAVENGLDLRRSDDSLHFDLAFDRRSNDYLVAEWADLDPNLLPMAELDRDHRIADWKESWHRPESLNRRAFFADVECDPQLLREATPYRYLEAFRTALASDGAATSSLPSILLGLSRILGAFGYDGPNLALQDGRNEGWAVLREIPAADFRIERRPGPSVFVEHQSDEIVLIHPRAQLALTLDSFELVMRAASGELINDAAANAIKLELSLLAGKLMLQPATAAVIIDPAGNPEFVTEVDGSLVLGGNSA